METHDDIQKAKGGDRDALNRLLVRNQRRLDRLAQRQLGSRLRAKVRTSDLLQSTFLDVVRGIDSFEGHSDDAFVQWVARILENNVRDKARFFEADRRTLEKEASDADAGSEVMPQPSPSTEVAFSEELLLVNRAIGSLPEIQRRVIELKVIQGRTHEEVAEALDRSVLATRSLLARARAMVLVEINRLRQAAAGSTE